MTTDQWIAVVSALASAGVFGALWKGIRSWLARREEREIKAIWKGHSELYEQMNQILFGTTANRVLILIANNNGGIPSAGHPVFISCLHEVHDLKAPSVKDDWDRRQIDAQYARLLSEIIERTEVDLVTADMKSGTLKTVYEGHNIERAWVRLVVRSKRHLIYVSAASTLARELRATEKVHLDSAAHRIAKILSQGSMLARFDHLDD